MRRIGKLLVTGVLGGGKKQPSINKCGKCGSVEIATKTTKNEPPKYFMECKGCKNKGPKKDSENDAILAWNEKNSSELGQI